CCRTLPKCRSDGFDEVTFGDEIPVGVDRDGQLCQRARCRAEYRLGEMQCVELRLVAGGEDSVGLLFVQRRRASQMRADLSEGEEFAEVEVLLAGAINHARQIGGPNLD